MGFHGLCSDLERQTDGLVISALEKGVRKTHVLQGTKYTENNYLAIYVLHSSYKILSWWLCPSVACLPVLPISLSSSFYRDPSAKFSISSQKWDYIIFPPQIIQGYCSDGTRHTALKENIKETSKNLHGNRQQSQWPSDDHFSGQASNQEERDSRHRIPVLTTAWTDILILSVVGPNVFTYGGCSCAQLSHYVGQPRASLMWILCRSLPSFKSQGTSSPDNTQKLEIPALRNPI